MKPAMELDELDTVAISRSMAQIADLEGDVADAYFERRDEVEQPAESEAPGLRCWSEQGLAVRLLRHGRTWLAARDTVDTESFQAAVRQVVRALPTASYPPPALAWKPPAMPVSAPELHRFPGTVHRLLKQRHVGFPLRLTVRRHRRWSRVVGTLLASEPQQEQFYSCVAELPWARHGCLLAQLDGDSAGELADDLLDLFRARQAAPVEPGKVALVLAPQAAAVLLHEAVAHALETDTLALGGRPAAAIGVRVGPETLAVLDDPAALPSGLRRTADDEGMPVVQRWLVRGGVVKQPLADRFAAGGSSELTPGAARRSSRHLPPAPRSSHLELVAGDAGLDSLLQAAEGGLYAPMAARGRLDPVGGGFSLELPFARRVRDGQPADYVGPVRLEGRVAELLDGIAAIGSETRFAGAGWCAKGGHKLPVWATAPALLLASVEVS